MAQKQRVSRALLLLSLFSAADSARVAGKRGSGDMETSSSAVAEAKSELPLCKDVAPDTFPGLCNLAFTKAACYSHKKSVTVEGGSVELPVSWGCEYQGDLAESMSDADCMARPVGYNVSDGMGSFLVGTVDGVYAGACRFEHELRQTELVACDTVSTSPGGCGVAPGACYSDKPDVTWMCWSAESAATLKPVCATIPLPGSTSEFYTGSCYWDSSVAEDNAQSDGSSWLRRRRSSESFDNAPSPTPAESFDNAPSPTPAPTEASTEEEHGFFSRRRRGSGRRRRRSDDY